MHKHTLRTLCTLVRGILRCDPKATLKTHQSALEATAEDADSQNRAED